MFAISLSALSFKKGTNRKYKWCMEHYIAPTCKENHPLIHWWGNFQGGGGGGGRGELTLSFINSFLSLLYDI